MWWAVGDGVIPRAYNVLPKVHDGKIRLNDGTVLVDDPNSAWSDHQKNVWAWDRRHPGLAYMIWIHQETPFRRRRSLLPSYTAHDMWETMSKGYGQSSNVILRVLESQLNGLFKKNDTTLEEHINKYCQVIEQINYRLKPSEKWSNERINRTFFGSTISFEQWGAYEDGPGDSINDMLPSELPARIKAARRCEKM